MNEHNKNAPDYVAKAKTILAILEENLKVEKLSETEIASLFKKLNPIRLKLPATELQIKYRISDMNVTYITRAYTDAGIAIGNYDE
jgi:hypothetical protein